MKPVSFILAFLPFVVQLVSADVSDQSQYAYESTNVNTPKFDWNITLLELLTIDKPNEGQGIYNCRSTYQLDDQSYDVEFFEKDCTTTPTDLDGNTFRFPLTFDNATETAVSSTEITTELEWTYNQTKIETSSLWTANKTGGYAEFCIRVNNYLAANAWDGATVGADPWYRQMHFFEATYKIELDALTDFNTTVSIERTSSTDGGTNNGENVINYEEEIMVFQCEDDFTETSPVEPLTQGDFLQLCVKTVDGSRFGVHSIKELDVSQDSEKLFPYVNGFLDSPLTDTACTASNTTDATCRAKMQLLSAYFDDDVPSDLFANGTVKLDYVGRRLSVDVPMNVAFNGARNGIDRNVGAARMLEEQDGGFGINVAVESSVDKESDATSISAGGLFSAAVAAFVATGIV